MAGQTIEKAAKALDGAIRSVRRLGESGARPAYVLAKYQAKKRALALAVLEEVRDVAAEFTSEAHCEHGCCDFCVNVALVRAQIEALGK